MKAIAHFFSKKLNNPDSISNGSNFKMLFGNSLMYFLYLGNKGERHFFLNKNGCLVFGDCWVLVWNIMFISFIYYELN